MDAAVAHATPHDPAPPLSGTRNAGTDDASELERFEVGQEEIVRLALLTDGSRARSTVGPLPSRDQDVAYNAHALADLAFLQRTECPNYGSTANPVRFADLFAGCGALSLGVMEAARAIGRGAIAEFVLDAAEEPLAVYSASLGVEAVDCADIASLLDGALGSRPSRSERALIGRGLAGLDLVVAGPPCQGHSALNNHSRHDDDRNDLYLRVVRFVELTHPRFVLIENVASITRDRRRSAVLAREYLERLDYATDEGQVDLNALGVPQLRRRHVLIAAARGERSVAVDDVQRRYRVPSPNRRTVAWAIEDLERVRPAGFDQPSVPTAENRERIEWLHGNGEYNLPNDLRPPCHRDDHTYKSMYGRLWWDRPAQTITSGYGSMGQGRYVHPRAKRTLTPHEAGRLQLIPDFFDFSPVTRRGAWAQMIGNAAPMKLSFAFVLQMLR